MRQVISLWLLVLLLPGCGGSIQGEKYADSRPLFDPYQFFKGEVTAWGIVQNRSGELVQQFTVRIAGHIDSNGELVLVENFSYSLGEGVANRIWRIKSNGEGSYQGSASDIMGVAEGRAFGNALQWQYEMFIPIGNSEYQVSFNDWMWLFDSDTLVNRSYIKKFGVVVAEVTLFMQRTDNTPQSQE